MPIEILCVEDDTSQQELIRLSFRDYRASSFHIVFAESMNEAMAKMAQGLKPAVVLLDYRMPGMDGEEAVKLMRQVVPNSLLVVLSGYNDHGTKRTCLGAGADWFISKPPSLMVIIDAVENLILLKEQREQTLNRVLTDTLESLDSAVSRFAH